MTVIDELALALFALSPDGSSTTAITKRLTRAVTDWADANGWAARTEARVSVEGDASTDARHGFIDVVVYRGRDGPDLAVEIDSGHKPWSVEKLRHAVAAGMHAIWIRWGDDDWAGVYNDVDVIQLGIRRRPLSRPPSSQLTLWVWREPGGVSAPS